MTEKKKIAVWAIVVVLLVIAIVFLLLGGKKDAEINTGSQVPGMEIELQQGESATRSEDVSELTTEPEVTPGVVELPFIPVD